jgi:hypothetical protein
MAFWLRLCEGAPSFYYPCCCWRPWLLLASLLLLAFLLMLASLLLLPSLLMLALGWPRKWIF